MEQEMQINSVVKSKTVKGHLYSKLQENKTTSNPVLARLINEVKNNNTTIAYDRVHNRHNRGGN
jgi:effector-binding domain-containing protein